MTPKTDEIARELVGRFTGGTLPLFFERGRTASGFLVERLNADGAPVESGFHRVMLLGRQLHTYSIWGRRLQHAGYWAMAGDLVDQLSGPFRDMDGGGWFARIDPEGKPSDTDKDLYAHAFVLFGLGSWIAAGGDMQAPHVRDLLDEGHRMMTDAFQRPDGSFSECLDRGGRDLAGERVEQNPHMHLLEACLLLLETTGEARWRALAEDVLALFEKGFYRPDPPVLFEHLRRDLTPDPFKGRSVEPGHHAEWAWLLTCASTLLARDDLHHSAEILLEAAIVRGWNASDGGLVDEIDAENSEILAPTRRLWPTLELAKALAGREKPVEGIGQSQVLSHLLDHRLSADGTWSERLGVDALTIADPTMPASSLYHLSMAMLAITADQETATFGI